EEGRLGAHSADGREGPDAGEGRGRTRRRPATRDAEEELLLQTLDDLRRGLVGVCAPHEIDVLGHRRTLQSRAVVQHLDDEGLCDAWFAAHRAPVLRCSCLPDRSHYPGAMTGSAVGVSDGARRRPAPLLTPYVRSYEGYRLDGFPPGTHLGMPSPEVTVILTISESVELSRGDGRSPERF